MFNVYIKKYAENIGKNINKLENADSSSFQRLND